MKSDDVRTGISVITDLLIHTKEGDIPQGIKLTVTSLPIDTRSGEWFEAMDENGKVYELSPTQVSLG